MYIYLPENMYLNRRMLETMDKRTVQEWQMNVRLWIGVRQLLSINVGVFLCVTVSEVILPLALH